MPPRRSSLVALVFVVLLATSAAWPAVAASRTDLLEQPARPGIDPADMDLSADPRQDFYRFANGGWLDRTQIPADKGQYGVFNEVIDRTTAQLLDLLNRPAADGALKAGTDEWKAVSLFEQGLDLETRNAQGVEPIRPILDEIDAIQDLAGFHKFMEGAGFRYLGGVFTVYASPDPKNSTVNAASLSGPFLGLPNRDYYLEETEGNEEARAAYRAAAAKLLTLTGYDPARAEAAAQAVYDLERSLAGPTLTREEKQDQSRSYNPTAVADLQTRYPLMDWAGFLETLGIPDVPQLIVTEPGYLDALPGIVSATPIEVLKDYLKLEAMWNFAGNLSAEVEQAAFDFKGRVLLGVGEMRPLEERALDDVNLLLGEAVGKLYVAEYFPPEAKAQITELVEAVKVAFGERLDANPWMTSETKAKAREKLDTMGLKVGYPDTFRSYGAVAIEGSYAESVLSASNADYRRNLRQVGQPVDRDEWFLPPQTVNAFYYRQGNEIVFPAAFLQPPFFDYRADPASNFGAIGFIIAHEITHGFDLQGSQFDARGNLNNWWTEADNAAFRALNDRVVQQFNAIEVLPGLFVDGQITVGENVADLGGVQVAYDALLNHLAAAGVAASPAASPGAVAFEGLTQEQRFFVSASTIWREQIRDEFLVTIVRLDTHAPSEIRGAEPLRHMDEFHEAFDIGPGDAMYLPPEERIVIW